MGRRGTRVVFASSEVTITLAADERGLVALTIGVCGNHREAALVFGGVQEVANERARRVRVAKGFALEYVDLDVEARLVGIATQVVEILEQHERVVVVRINNALIRSEPRQHYGSTIQTIVQQTNQ